jgi:ribosomal protein S18 acetylase RimI-like enzyme
MIKKAIFLICISAELFSVEIRKPTLAEIKDIAALYYTAWHATYDTIAPHLSSVRTRENCLKQWTDYYHKKNHFILVAVQDRTIVGVIFAGPLENKNPSVCANYDSEIDKLYVATNLKNQGIGSQLLKVGFDMLHARGFTKTIVRSLTKNHNTNKFYEKRGGILIAQPVVQFNETMNIYGFTIN